MASVVNAEVDSLEVQAALYDARFARSMLVFIGMFLAGMGFYLGMIWAVVIGVFSLGSAWYFQAIKIPELEQRLAAARRALGLALGRLGQQLPPE